jgi:prevent-host-death family protein
MTRVGMHEAKTTLSKLVALAEGGEDVVIERRGRPVARIVKYQPPRLSRRDLHGISAGRIWMADDFDAPLPDLEAAMYEEDT